MSETAPADDQPPSPSSSRAGSSERSGSRIARPTRSRAAGSACGRPRTTQWGMLRLTSVGRQSGRTRVAIVGYIVDGPNLVVPAMNGWADPEPAWWLNLQAHPRRTVELPERPTRRDGPCRGRRGARSTLGPVPRPQQLGVQRRQRGAPVARDGARRAGTASRRREGGGGPRRRAGQDGRRSAAAPVAEGAHRRRSGDRPSAGRTRRDRDQRPDRRPAITVAVRGRLDEQSRDETARQPPDRGRVLPSVARPRR